MYYDSFVVDEMNENIDYITKMLEKLRLEANERTDKKSVQILENVNDLKDYLYSSSFTKADNSKECLSSAVITNNNSDKEFKEALVFDYSKHELADIICTLKAQIKEKDAIIKQQEENFQKFVNEEIGKLTEEIKKSYLQNQFQQAYEFNMLNTQGKYDALTVAKCVITFLTNKNIFLNHETLNQIMFLLQEKHLKEFKRPLFKDDFVKNGTKKDSMICLPKVWQHFSKIYNYYIMGRYSTPSITPQDLAWLKKHSLPLAKLRNHELKNLLINSAFNCLDFQNIIPKKAIYSYGVNRELYLNELTEKLETEITK